MKIKDIELVKELSDRRTMLSKKEALKFFNWIGACGEEVNRLERVGPLKYYRQMTCYDIAVAFDALGLEFPNHNNCDKNIKVLRRKYPYKRLCKLIKEYNANHGSSGR